MPKQKSLFDLQFTLLCVSSLLFFASFNMIVPDLYDYIEAMGGGELKGLIIALFTVTAGFSRPFSGKLADTVGRVPVMIFGVAVCVLLGVLYPVVSTVWALLLLRLLHGFSTGFKPTGTSAFIADIVPANRRGEAMGFFGVFGSTGMAIGPAIGPRITAAFSLDIMFYVSAFVAFLSIAILFGMKETLSNKQKFKWSLLKIKKDEILEPRVFNPSITLLLTSFTFGAAITLAPDMAIQMGFSQEEKGIFFTVFVVCSLLVRIVAGKVSDRYGRVIVLKWAIVFIIAANISMALTHSQEMLIISAAIFGFAIGMNSPTIYAWTIDLSLDKARGKGIATMYIALEIGIGLGAFVAGFIYSNEAENIPFVFVTCAVLALLALLFLFFGLDWGKKLIEKYG
jgi:MFS family permease